MSWDDIAGNTEFQALPEERQQRVRENYFKERVAPNVPPEQLPKVRDEFMAYRPKPLPPGALQVARQAGQLLGHAARSAANPDQLGLRDLLGPRLVPPSDLPEQLQETSRAAVKDLTKAAHTAAKNLGVDVDETPPLHPGIAQLGVNEPLHAFQAVLDKMLPEVAALGPWKDRRGKPLSQQLDDVAAKAPKDPVDATAVAPRREEKRGVFDLPFRQSIGEAISDPRELAKRAQAGASAPIPILHRLSELQTRGPGNAAMVAQAVAQAGYPSLATTAGVLAGLPTTLSEVVTPVPGTVGEVEAMGAMVLAPEAVRLGGNQLPVFGKDLGPVWKDFVGKALQAEYRIKKVLGVPQHLELVPFDVKTALAEGRIKLADAAKYNQDIYDAELAKRVPKNTNSALKGVQQKTGASSDAMAAAAADADRAAYIAAHDHVIAQAAQEAGRRMALKPMPVSPAEIARLVIGAHAVSPQMGNLAGTYPHLYAAATGASVPQAVVSRYQALTNDLATRGVTPGPLADMLAEGVTTGKANLIELSELNEALHAETLKAAGAHPPTVARHQADAYTAAQRPAETLVVEHMRQQAEKAAAEARDAATREVFWEARRVTDPPAPERPLPTREETVRRAVEEGLDPAEASRAHYSAALERHQAGTLSDAVSAEYAGDPAFASPPAEPASPAAGPVTSPPVSTPKPPQPAHDLLRTAPLSERSLKASGLSGDLGAFRERGVSVKQGGVSVKDAIKKLIADKVLPEGSTVTDLLNLLDQEALAPAQAASQMLPLGAVERTTPDAWYPPGVGTPPETTAPSPPGPGESATASGTPSRSGTTPAPSAPETPSSSYLDIIRGETSEGKLKFGKETASANWVDIHPELQQELEHVGRFVKRMQLLGGEYTQVLLNRIRAEAEQQFSRFAEMPENISPKQTEFLRSSLDRAARRYTLATGEEPPAEVLQRLAALSPEETHSGPLSLPENVEPAFRDTATGKVYTGPNHDDIAKMITDPALRAKAQKAADANTDAAGFVVNGEYINRTEANKRYGFRTSQELESLRSRELAAGGARGDVPPGKRAGAPGSPEGVTPPPREGGFAGGLPRELPSTGEAMPLEMPELVRLARQLIGEYPIIAKSLGRSRGLFIPQGRGKIKLRADLFADVDQAAKTLAHELGHADDYLPDQTMARGNLIGRVMSFKKFLKGEFGELKEAELRKELMSMSAYWRPWDRGASSAEYARYRDGSDELFADAVSVFLNSPGTLEKIAPKFFRALLDHMDRKPEFKAAWLDVQDLLRGNREELLASRRQDIREMGMKSEEILIRKKAEKQLYEQSIAERSAQELLDRYYPILRAANELEAMGVPIPDHLNPKYVLQEGDMVGNEKALLDLGLDRVLNPLWRQHGLGEVELHEYMFNNRVLHDRAGLGNPLGTTPDVARENLAYLERQLGPEKYQALVQAAQDVQDLFWPVVEEAHELGVIGKELWENAILPNKGNYVTFSVLEHLEKSGYISAGVAQQTGTLKEVGNTFLNTRLKTQAMMARNLDQKNKLSLKAVWDARFPGEMTKTEVVRKGTGTGFERPKPGKEVLRIYEDGAPVAYDVDPYVAEAFAKWKPAQMSLVHRVLNPMNQTLKLMYTSWNAGFAGFSSPVRYFQKTWKGLSGVPGATAQSLLVEYVKSLPQAYKKSIGLPDDFVQSLLKEKALDVDMAELELVPSLNSYAQKLKARQLLQNGAADHGLWGRVAEKMLYPARQLLHGMQVAADTMTGAWKIAAAKLRIRAGETGKEMAYNVRNYAGVPNPRVKGLSARTLNDIFLFSNIGQRHYVTALQVLTQPKTRGGAALKTAALDVVPSLLQTAALLGVFGVGLQEFYRRVSKYHLRHYTVLPLGHLQGGEWKWKAVYLPLPHDDAGRIVHALTHEVVKGVHDRDPAQFAAMMGEIFSIVPSKTPALGIPQAWIQEYTGGRYWDDFRQRTAIPDRVEKIGGLLKLEKMVEWTLDASGVANFSAYDPAKRTTTEVALQATPLLNRLIVVSDYGLTEDFRRQIEGTPNAAELYRLQEKKRGQMGVLVPEDRQRLAQLMREAKAYKRGVKKRQREEAAPKAELREEIRRRINP